MFVILKVGCMEIFWYIGISVLLVLLILFVIRNINLLLIWYNVYEYLYGMCFYFCDLLRYFVDFFEIVRFSFIYRKFKVYV